MKKISVKVDEWAYVRFPWANRIIFLLALIFGMPTSIFADDLFHDGQNFMSGSYKIIGVRTAGIYPGDEEVNAATFKGRQFTVHGMHVALPTGALCHITSTSPVELKDDRMSFGTSGGSWSELGLQKSQDGSYEVAEILFDCDEAFSGMFVQPESDTYLLRFWSVYLELSRE